MSDDWLSLLRARVAEIGVAPTARELGVSHGSVSTLIHEKYPGDTWRMADRVMKRYARNPCPYNGEMVSYHDCARYAGKSPRRARRLCAAGGRARNANSTLTKKDNVMFAEKIERQITHAETVLRTNPAGIADILPIILKNLRGEISALKDAEDEALKLYIANQHAKEALNA